jgi:hypothetical protein
MVMAPADSTYVALRPGRHEIRGADLNIDQRWPQNKDVPAAGAGDPVSPTLLKLLSEDLLEITLKCCLRAVEVAGTDLARRIPSSRL